MKQVFIKNFDEFQKKPQIMTHRADMFIEGGDDMIVSDGFHTFDELYDHRITLFIALCRSRVDLGAPHHAKEIWRSQLHSDGSRFDGWFIMGIGKEPGKQITYHLPTARWEETEFVITLEKAPDFDGHTSLDVVERLKLL